MQVNPHSVEIVLFKFSSELAHGEQCRRMASMQQWLSSQPGFVGRQCFYDEQANRWVDVVEWADATVAAAAMARSMEDPALAEVLSSIDADSIDMGHYAPRPI